MSAKDIMNGFIKILGNKRMYKRLIILLLIIGAVTCYGFYSGAIADILAAIFGGGK